MKEEKIIKASSTIGILGLGLFGTSVARTLTENNVDVIVMDKNIDHLEEVIDVVAVGVQGDFTKLDQLSEAGFADCDEVVIASAERLEDSILAILNLRKPRVNAPEDFLFCANLLSFVFYCHKRYPYGFQNTLVPFHRNILHN